MDDTAELAGFFAAHALWCIVDGSTLTPMLAFEHADGNRVMHRMVTDRLEDGVAKGREWLAAPPEDVRRAVLIYDGYLTLPTGKTDALFVEAQLLAPPTQSFMMAIPYRHATQPQGFAVHRPKFLSFAGPPVDPVSVGQAFFRGVAKHEPGSAVWEEYLDESL